VTVVIAEPITDPVSCHGEGPVWSARWGGLRWVDMFAGDILALGPQGRIDRCHVGSIAAALRPRRDGGAVIAVERGFVIEEADGSLRPLDPLWSQSALRMNEGACDPDGRFYCGSMACDRQVGAGRMYRLDPDRSVRVVLKDLTLSNGLDWSPDGSRAYYIDSHTQAVDVFDYDLDGGLTGRRPFVSIDRDDGHPDGLTVDRDGGVWVAVIYGGQVRRYDPAGVLDEVVEVASRKVTACTFGGPRLDELFITTSRLNVAPDEDRLAGSVFRAAVGVQGLPVREFAG
jgi:sugar lactone lactonase YvrE